MHQMVDRGRFPPTKSSQSDTLQEVKSPILVNPPQHQEKKRLEKEELGLI